MIERVRAQQTASAAAATEVGSLRARLAVIEQVCVCYTLYANWCMLLARMPVFS
jgi:hypothetical protein